MAAGVPVIASDRVGAAAELIEDGKNGFVYPVGDVVKLAQILVSSFADPAALRSIGMAARTKALAHGHEFAAANLVSGARQALEAPFIGGARND
jgi:glycosyltransferase involved in cell wall biosynthesis